MKVYILSILLAGVALTLTSCNKTPEAGSVIASQLGGKLFKVGADGAAADVSSKAGVSHYVFYHSASW